MSRIKFGDFAINLTEKKKPTPDEQLLYIGLEHLDSNCLHVTRWGSEVPIKGEKLVMHKGDILLGKRNAYLRRAAIAPHDGVFSAHGMVLRPKEGIIDSNFFPIFIGSDYFFDAAIKISVGSLSPTINWKDLKELEFNIPDLPEQKKIATLFWALDRTKEGYKRLLTITDELVKSRFIEMFGNPVQNYNHWKQYKLKDVTSKIGSGATPRGGKESYPDEGISFIRSMNVHDGYFEFKDLAHLNDDQAMALNTVTIEKNDVLINITGASVARTCVVPEQVLPARVNQHVSIIRCLHDVVNPVFINRQFLDSSFKRHLLNMGESGGATRQAITKQQLEEMLVIVPPIVLQNQFADFVAQVDKSKLALQESLDKLEKLQKALIKKYLG